MTVAWNPSDKAGVVVLSNSNLTASRSGGTGYACVRGDTGQSSGDWTFEVNVDARGDNVGVGIANTVESLSVYPGSTWESVGYFYDGWMQNGGANVTMATYTIGDIISVRARKTANEVLFYKNGTLIYTWTGVLTTGDWYPIVSVRASTDQLTANFGATDLSYLQSGSLSWDGSQPVGAFNYSPRIINPLQLTPYKLQVAPMVNR